MRRFVLLLILAVSIASSSCSKDDGSRGFTRKCTYRGETVTMPRIVAYRSDNVNWNFDIEAFFSDLDLKIHFIKKAQSEGSDNVKFYNLYDKDGNSLDERVTDAKYRFIMHSDYVVTIYFEIDLEGGEKIVGDYHDKYSV